MSSEIPQHNTIPDDCLTIDRIAAELAFYEKQDYPADQTVQASMSDWADDEALYFPRWYAERKLVALSLSERITDLADAGTLALYAGASRYDKTVSKQAAKEQLGKQQISSKLVEKIQTALEREQAWWSRVTLQVEKITNEERAHTRYEHHLRQWFLHDTWAFDDALKLVCGIDPAPGAIVMVPNPRFCRWASIEMIDGSTYDLPSWADGNMVKDAQKIGIELPPHSLQADTEPLRRMFENEFTDLQELWRSAEPEHAERNPPQYYVNWATSKGHRVPWLELAAFCGFIDEPSEANGVRRSVAADAPSRKQRDRLAGLKPSIKDQMAAIVEVRPGKAREELILLQIKAMGLDPKALPKGPNGKAGVKKTIYEKLSYRNDVFSRGTFDETWQDLLDFEHIKYVEAPPSN